MVDRLLLITQPVIIQQIKNVNFRRIMYVHYFDDVINYIVWLWRLNMNIVITFNIINSIFCKTTGFHAFSHF